MGDIETLARTIWGEARGEPVAGQVAVQQPQQRGADRTCGRVVQDGAAASRTSTRQQGHVLLRVGLHLQQHRACGGQGGRGDVE